MRYFSPACLVILLASSVWGGVDAVSRDNAQLNTATRAIARIKR